MLRALRATVITIATLALPACGPIEYIATVPLDAAGALAEAKHVNGDKYAPYEMTAAQEYIQKSRELAGYARFHSAVGFGGKAADNARKAKKIAIEKAALPEEHNEPAAPPAIKASELAPPNATPAADGSTTTQTIVRTDQPSAPSTVTIVPTAPAPVEAPRK